MIIIQEIIYLIQESLLALFHNTIIYVTIKNLRFEGCIDESGNCSKSGKNTVKKGQQ